MTDPWRRPNLDESPASERIRALAAVLGGIRRLLIHPGETLAVFFGAQLLVGISIFTVVGWVVVAPLVGFAMIRWLVTVDADDEALVADFATPIPWLRQVVAFWAWVIISVCGKLLGLVVFFSPLIAWIRWGPGIDPQAPEAKVALASIILVASLGVYGLLFPVLRAPFQLALVELARGRSIREGFSSGFRGWRENPWALTAVFSLLSPIAYVDTTVTKAASNDQVALWAGEALGLAPELTGFLLVIGAAELLSFPLGMLGLACTAEAWTQLRPSRPARR